MRYLCLFLMLIKCYLYLFCFCFSTKYALIHSVNNKSTFSPHYILFRIVENFEYSFIYVLTLSECFCG